MSSTRRIYPIRSLLVGTAVLVLTGAVSCGAETFSCSSKPKKDETIAPKEKQKKKPEDDRWGGHIKLPSNEPEYLNPAISTTFDRVNMQIFEGLMGLAIGSDGTLETVPRLAATQPTVSKDQTTITFALRKDVTWSDGKPFTAKDVEFTYKAIMNTSARTVWKAYMPADEWPKSGVKAKDDHTVVVRYKQPSPVGVTAWIMGIIPRHVYCDTKSKTPCEKQDVVANTKANKSSPIGTGPFKLRRWEPGKRIILDKNPTWWYGKLWAKQNKEKKTLPYLESVEFVFTVKDTETLSALQKGVIDFAHIASIKQWSVEAQRPEFIERYRVTERTEPRIRMIAWNNLRGPLQDKRVRIALTHAANRPGMIEDLLLQQAEPLSAPFFPTMFGADQSIAPYPFSLETASKMLDAAGYKAKPDGSRFPIELILRETNRGRIAEDVLNRYRADLKKIGIDLRINFLTAGEYRRRLNLKEYDAVYLGWVPDVPDPDPWALLHSDQVDRGSNYPKYINEQVDKLLEQARKTTVKTKRAELYHQVHKIVHEDEPYTMLFAPKAHYAWDRRIRSVRPEDIGPQPRFPGLARWWLDKTSKKPAKSAK